MLVEPFTSFIVPTLYCAYKEFKMRLGLSDPDFSTAKDVDPPEEPKAALVSSTVWVERPPVDGKRMVAVKSHVLKGSLFLSIF